MTRNSLFYTILGLIVGLSIGGLGVESFYVWNKHKIDEPKSKIIYQHKFPQRLKEWQGVAEQVYPDTLSKWRYIDSVFHFGTVREMDSLARTLRLIP